MGESFEFSYLDKNHKLKICLNNIFCKQSLLIYQFYKFMCFLDFIERHIMMINSINLNLVNKKSLISKQPQYSLYSKNADTVSFSGLKKSEKAGIPFKLQSKMQDEFHATSSQIYMRKYLDLKSQGFSDEEIARKMFPSSFERGKEDEIKEVVNYVSVIHKRIDDIDASFKEVVPSLFPKTYYRGIVDSSSNRALKTINEAEIGDIIKPDLGYPFMASKKEYAEGYSQYTDGSSNPETCAVMIIKTPAGTPISRDISFNLFSGDSNAVLARGANFKVLDKQIKNNKTYITLQYLNCALDEEK